jgi:EF-hand domain pair
MWQELDTKRVGYLENDDLEKVINFMYHSLGAKDSGNKKEGTKRDLLGRLRMAKVDANGDGKLDVDEFIALFENVSVLLGITCQCRN